MTEQLTVIIPCKDERRNIRPCIESAWQVADELLVADSGSTDGTLDIVRGIGGCRIIEREYVHSGDFKNWAIPQARCPWVMILDADERITPQMADEIRRVLAAPTADGYWVYRDNFFLGHRVRHSGWQRDRVLRLFRRHLGRYEGATDHAEVHIRSGRTAVLRARLLHFTYWTYDDFLRKLDRYTTVQAQRWYAAGKRPSFARLLLHGPLRFAKSYFLQLGFLDGWVGLQVCAMTGWYSFMKQARLWELHRAHPQPDPEAARTLRKSA